MKSAIFSHKVTTHPGNVCDADYLLFEEIKVRFGMDTVYTDSITDEILEPYDVVMMYPKG